MILARLDLLAPDERRIAQRAAVVGREFWDGTLARLVQVDDLDAALRTLRRREFVLERVSSSIPGHGEYAFKHVLIRDVAYASLPRRERGRAHAETAAWIEETSGERTGELAELLAHHYDAAFSFLRDDVFRQRARSYLLTGAANAQRRFAIRQGDRLARRAVELSEGAAERVESLEALGDLQYLAFMGDAAWRTYIEALAELAMAIRLSRVSPERPRCSRPASSGRCRCCPRSTPCVPSSTGGSSRPRPRARSARCSSSTGASCSSSARIVSTRRRRPPSTRRRPREKSSTIRISFPPRSISSRPSRRTSAATERPTGPTSCATSSFPG